MGKKKTDRYAEFRALTRDEQRKHILDVASLCIDGVPVSLARQIEIYIEGENDES